MKKLPEPMFEAGIRRCDSPGFPVLALRRGGIFLPGKSSVPSSDYHQGNGNELLYRGWILTEERYRRFHDALSGRGYYLVSSAAQYAEVTYFPTTIPRSVSVLLLPSGPTSPILSWPGACLAAR